METSASFKKVIGKIQDAKDCHWKYKSSFGKILNIKLYNNMITKINERFYIGFIRRTKTCGEIISTREELQLDL